MNLREYFSWNKAWPWDLHHGFQLHATSQESFQRELVSGACRSYLEMFFCTVEVKHWSERLLRGTGEEGTLPSGMLVATWVAKQQKQNSCLVWTLASVFQLPNTVQRDVFSNSSPIVKNVLLTLFPLLSQTIIVSFKEKWN